MYCQASVSLREAKDGQHPLLLNNPAGPQYPDPLSPAPTQLPTHLEGAAHCVAGALRVAKGAGLGQLGARQAAQDLRMAERWVGRGPSMVVATVMDAAMAGEGRGAVQH